MQNEPLVFCVDGLLTPVSFYEAEYPLRQTQALLLTVDELSAWVDQARLAVGTSDLPALGSYRDWLAMIENLIEDLWFAVEEEPDERLIACRLSADDPLIEQIDTVLDNLPSLEDIRDQIRGKAMGDTLTSLLGFWIQQVEDRIRRLSAIAIGDGEVLAILKRQDVLAQVHF